MHIITHLSTKKCNWLNVTVFIGTTKSRMPYSHSEMINDPVSAVPYISVAMFLDMIARKVFCPRRFDILLLL